MRLVLLGPPGAGKGTLASLLKEELNAQHISTGDILREEMKKGSELGVQVKSFVENGDLVPDEVVSKIIEQRLKQDANSNQSYMLDGFPRTVQQAQDLDRILKDISKEIDLALYFDVSLPVIIQRLTGRRVCKQCGALYHITNKLPTKEGICDVCGGQLYQRPDDNEETIKTRMEVYLKNITPIIDYYEQQGKLRKVDSNQDAQDTKIELMKIVKQSGTIDTNQVQRRD